MNGKLAVLHISDIHLKVTHAGIIDKLAEKIALATASKIFEPMDIVLAISGDLAFSGQQDEYELFDKFTLKIESTIRSQGKIRSIRFIAVPGNHDCDFVKQSSVRQVLLSSSEIASSAEIFQEVAKVQKNFWDYVSMKTDGEIPNYPVSYFVRDLFGVRFVCLNTSWMSQRREEQGKLRIYPDFSKINTDGLYTIVMYHHPYNWINSSDSFELKGKIEEIASISLSGHEHSTDMYEKVRYEKSTIYLEAGAILENSEYSRFNLIIIDFDKKSLEINAFQAKAKNNIVEVKELRTRYEGKLETRASRDFFIRKEFEASITTMDGIVEKTLDVNIRSAFIYPNLERLNDNGRIEKDPIYSSDVFNYLKERALVFIHGQPNSGKTSFSRRFYLDLYDEGLYPIQINLENITNSDIPKDIIGEYIKKQYEGEDSENFYQIDINLRPIIIDNAEGITQGTEKYDKILEFVIKNFGKIYIFSSIDPLEAILIDLKEKHTIDVTRLRILPMNSHLRRKLVESYIDITNRGVEKDRLYYQRIAEIEATVDASLRNQLVSAFPIYILGIVQYYVQSSGKLITGSNNFVYDLLVRISIAKISSTDSDYSIFETYLSHLAYKMHSENIFELDEQSIDEFTISYIDEYKFRGVISEKQLVKTLKDAGILENNQGYRFKHRHLIYYFTAIYLRNYHSEGEQEKYVSSMIINLHEVKNLNTLAFLVFLTKDFGVVEKIMAYVENIIGLFPQKNMDDITYEIRNKDEDIERFLKESFVKDSNKLEKINEDQELENPPQASPEIIKVLSAMRVMELLGQIVKNHVGSWDGYKKSLVIGLCYDITTKVSGNMFFLVDEILKDIAEGELSRSDYKEKSLDFNEISGSKKSVLVSAIKNSANAIMEHVATGLILRASDAMSSSKLKDVYREIDAANKNINYKLIDAAISMNTLASFPEQKIKDLGNNLEDKKFAYQILRRIVYIHFLNYGDRGIIRDKMFGNFKISDNKPKPYNKKLLKGYQKRQL